MRASIGFQSGYAPNTAPPWRYSSSLLWPPFPAESTAPAAWHPWLPKAHSWFTSVLAEGELDSPLSVQVFQFGLIFHPWLELPKTPLEFGCIEDLLSACVRSSFESSASSGRVSDICAVFFCTVRGWANHSYTEISKGQLWSYYLILAIWGIWFWCIFRTLLSERPGDNDWLPAAETHDSQIKLMQSKTQPRTVFSNLWGIKAPLVILLKVLWNIGKNKVIDRDIRSAGNVQTLWASTERIGAALR